MIVGDFHVVRVLAVPSKADAELVVDADTVVASAVSFQCFESIAWREPQFFESRGGFKLSEFAEGGFQDR